MLYINNIVVILYNYNNLFPKPPKRTKTRKL